uniref:Variant erythrocyte surface antigen-1, alpha subunit n=1 Tax=Babesia bovis TaxID=5865 RepID=A7AMB1_BABBO|eukprot:XP_001611263.1 variant erythrocyte surface antigen-1, alpha subunit [Babesia bovis T2Bo]
MEKGRLRRNRVIWINGVVGAAGAVPGCGGGQCQAGTHGKPCDGGDGVCKCTSVVSCTGVLPVLYKYGFGYGDVSKLHPAGECICGLAAAVTDLLQSVELEYNGKYLVLDTSWCPIGYQGEAKDKGASQEEVTNRLNGLFSLVQGLGGTAVVRTYIDQLAQVLSALVGWSRIVQCEKGSGCGGNPHGKGKCEYLKDLTPNDMSCGKCGCLKVGPDNHHLGRGCTKCDGDKCGNTGSGGGCQCKCKDGTCTRAGDAVDNCKCDRRCCCTIDTYRSAYRGRYSSESYVEGTITAYRECMWNSSTNTPTRHQCARILLGSVCLIWSGLTYMYWTGKWAKGSPRWNNHILDGSGLDDGTLSQWLQALGFPKGMLNNSGPKNRLDKVIWDGLRDMLFLGFLEPSGLSGDDVKDENGNTARSPFGMNYAGFVHTAHRDSFNTDQATVFPNGTSSSTTDTNLHKCGALYKLYILSCAYFTGLQNKAAPKADNRTPRTIREILYWLSALPYSQAYPKILKHGKDRLTEVLKKPGETESGTDNDQKQLAFHQTGRTAPITVDEFNLFAHFQAVTQYCPLVLIGIHGGLGKGTNNTKEPAIHSLYANSHFSFTYPEVKIQAYNQVVHYIRALFYQLYFLRKQCAVKVALGGKWRECRYGHGVVSKGVISWMCLGCDPMEHDRNYRVENMKKGLDGVVNKLKALEGKDKGAVDGVMELRKGLEAAKSLLDAIGQVVVQLGNAQERLDTGKSDLDGVMKALKKVFSEVNNGSDLKDVLQKVLGEKLCEKVGALEKAGGLKDAKAKATEALKAAKEAVEKQNGTDVDPCKNLVSAAIHGLHKALVLLKEGVKKQIEDRTDQLLKAKKNLSHVFAVGVSVDEEYTTLLNAINQLISLCTSPKCPGCKDHAKKCGQPSNPTVCQTCLQPTTTGVPSPLQAFLEDRLPGFSCDVVRDIEDPDKYPPAASHLGHCNGSGQCCPLPMGFRNQFYSGSIGDMTGSRLYGILYFFSNENMMQSCVYRLVRVTSALSATTPQVLGDVFGFFRGGVGNKEEGKNQSGQQKNCDHTGDPSGSYDENKDKYFCGWCASGLREEVKKIEWIPNGNSTPGGHYMDKVGKALIGIKGEKNDGSGALKSSAATANTSLSRLTENCQYLSPLTGELYTAVSATFGGTYLSWVLYLSDALHSGLESLASEFKQIECRGCKGQCDPNKCKKGSHGTNGGGQCGCQSIVSCTGVLPVLYRHGFSYGNPFNLEGYHQRDGKTDGQYDIEDKKKERTKQCHQFLDSLSAVIDKNKQDTSKVASQNHPLTELLKQVGKLQHDIRLPWIFVLTIAWLVAVLYLAFGAIWPLDWTHMRSHWLRGGAHQWQSMWYKVMTGRKGRVVLEGVENFGQCLVVLLVMF